MPLIGEWVYPYTASHFGDDFITPSWEVNIPPTPTLVKVFVSSFSSSANAIADARILQYRRRLPDGSDETIVTRWGEAVKVLFEGSLSSVTFAVSIRNCIVDIMGILGFWE